MNQRTLFDDTAGELAKEHGMQVAADANPTDLEVARWVAEKLARADLDNCTDADAVGEVLHQEYGIVSLGPAAGSLFKGACWEFTGIRRRSRRKKNHAREIKVWRWVGSNGAAD